MMTAMVPTFTEHGGLFFDLDFSRTQSPMEEAVLVSLFTDRRLGKEKGWWGDSLPLVDNTEIGSHLFTLFRQVQNEHTRLKAERFCEAALQWLLDEGYCTALEVVASYPAKHVLLLCITLTLANGQQELIESRMPL